jgi:hypothetical protein
MKIVKNMKLQEGFGILTEHYRSINSLGEDIDEGDLIIFRLLGAKFEYSAVEFNPSFLPSGSDVS